MRSKEEKLMFAKDHSYWTVEDCSEVIIPDELNWRQQFPSLTVKLQ